MEVVKGRGYVYSIQYHIVWCVKYRRDVLNGQVNNDSRKRKNATECILCYECVKACPTKALY